MANLWCDGFGRYGGDKTKMLNGSSGQAWAEVDTEFTLSTSNVRTGTYCLRYVATDSSFQETRRVFGSQLTEVFYGYALHCSNLPSDEPRLVLPSLHDQANDAQLSFILGTDGAIEVRRGIATGTVLGRSNPVIGAGAYQHIEVHAIASNTTGSVEIRVDEVTVLNLTGIDTIATSNVEFSQLRIGGPGAATPAGGIYSFADFYANDTVDDGSGCHTWIGDVKSAVRWPDANTAQDDFTKSSGTSAYELIDEAPPNDSDYIETTASTAQTNVGISNGPANTTEILTVRPFVRAQKDDAGTATIAPSMVSNGTKATVSGQPITTAFAYYDNNVPLDPDTSAPWDSADLDSALEAIERTA